MSMLIGSLVAIVTPMLPTAEGGLDLPRFKQLIDWHVAEGTAGIVVVGTTGESPTVTMAENEQLIAAAVGFANGRIPIIAGTGANSTHEAIHLSRAAKAAGADFQLSVVPYYNKPTQEGLYQHFRAVAEATDLPLILYNVPGRTVADLQNDTVIRLSQLPNVVGLKESTSSFDRVTDLLKRVRPDFAVYSGNDEAAMGYMLMGAHGVISVTANVAPRLMAQMCEHALAGRNKAAREINERLIGLHKHLFVEANPIPVKWALNQMGRIEGGIRLPLTPLSATHEALVRSAMLDAGIDIA
jgi:4-hydroxy-tetrahydrodipicolinate synthase